MLDNLLGIDSHMDLMEAEERVSKAAAMRLYETGRLDALDSGTFGALAEIHRCLFGSIYEWAGRMRDVNLSKGGFRFVPALYLPEAVEKIEAMPQSTPAEAISKYVEMNVAHPFREGNGRSGRIWLDGMMRALGRTIDWSRISREDYLLAMERSPVRDTEIQSLVIGALSEDLDDHTLLARAIDASYAYEGYDRYETRGLRADCPVSRRPRGSRPARGR